MDIINKKYDGDFTINHRVITLVGLESAFLMYNLMVRRRILIDSGEIKNQNSYFKVKVDDIKDSLGLSKVRQAYCIESLRAVGFIETKLFGLPMARHFKINDSAIDEFLTNGYEAITKNIFGDVYLIRSTKRDLYKIGKTKNSKQRTRAIITKEGGGEVVFIHENIPFYSKKELMFHEMFSDKRIIGEWFHLDNDDIEKFKKGINGNK